MVNRKKRVTRAEDTPEAQATTEEAQAAAEEQFATADAKEADDTRLRMAALGGL